MFHFGTQRGSLLYCPARTKSVHMPGIPCMNYILQLLCRKYTSLPSHIWPPLPAGLFSPYKGLDPSHIVEATSFFFLGKHKLHQLETDTCCCLRRRRGFCWGGREGGERLAALSTQISHGPRVSASCKHNSVTLPAEG